MLETIAVVLFLLWAFVAGAGLTVGGLVHVLLALALVFAAARGFRGRRAP
jgi:hypothetical protein